jgi:hypothetical protein
MTEDGSQVVDTEDAVASNANRRLKETSDTQGRASLASPPPQGRSVERVASSPIAGDPPFET